MKIIVIIAGLIIGGYALITIINERNDYNYNSKQFDDHPIITIFSGGANLKRTGYSYTPPFTSHESGILLLGAAGIVVFLIGISIPSEND